MSTALRALAHLVEHGPRNALGWGWFHLNEAYYERRLEVTTAETAAWGRGAYQHLDGHIHYEPLPYVLINNILRAITPRAAEKEVFLDYGSGMGRVVVMAARRPFARVIGVELVASLNEIAQQNVRSARRHLRCPVDLVTADATTYVVPDDVSTIHLFNPFTGTVMSRVQDRIQESLERAPRRLRIVYSHAHDQADLFASCRWVSRVRGLPIGVMSGMSIHLYESRALSGLRRPEAAGVGA